MIQRGSGTELKGNAIENKGNTTEKYPIFHVPQSFYFLIFNLKGNALRATHARRSFP